MIFISKTSLDKALNGLIFLQKYEEANMKKFICILLCFTLLALTLGLGACNGNDVTADSGNNNDEILNGNGHEEIITLRIGATPVPHARILELIAPYLLEEGIELQIQVYTDFAFPNPSLADGSLDANFFQHLPFLEMYINATGNQLHVMGSIHIEPMGAYSMTLDCISELPQSATVAIPSCGVNGPRALMLLEQHGILELDEYAGTSASVSDITYNPLDLNFMEMDAAMLPRVMLDEQADLSIINTNHVLAGTQLSPMEDSLIMEGYEGSPYANMLVVRPEDANNPALLTLLRHMQSDIVREYILENFSGVVPVF